MYKITLCLLISFAFLSFRVHAQISGCTDPQGINYNPSAVINDGSCTYAATSLSLTDKTALSAPLLNETSGLALLNGKLWTFCDSGNPNDIYRIDTASSTVLQTVDISNATNVDWEDMASSNDHLFIGDFGNNNGNRQDLKIYRINKSDLTGNATTVTSSIINFSYSDQTSFPSLPNNNNFDCEAMIFMNDSIHLFSKNWVDNQTRHYVLPNIPGTQVAQYRETYNAGFLVTGASVQPFGVIALIGYLKTGSKPVSLCLFYDYKNNYLFNGNKREFDLSTMLINGQTEGVEFYTSSRAFVSNELYTSGTNVPAKLRTFNIASYLPPAFLFPRPTAGFTAGSVLVCENTFIQFTDQSSGSPNTWKWNFPGGTPATSTLQHPQVQYSTAGTYAVTLIVSNAAGNDTIIKTSYITVNPSPLSAITASGPVTFCQGDQVFLNASSGTGSGYQWKINGVDIPGANTANYTANTAGIYTCLVSNSCGNLLSNALTVTVNTVPASPSVPGGSSLICLNTSANLYAVNTVNGATSYTWSIPSGAAIASGQGMANISVDFSGTTQSGALCVAASNSCGSSTPSCLSVTVSTSVPAKPVSISGNNISCAGSTGIVYSCPLVVNASGYSWTVPSNTTITNGQGTNSITVSFLPAFTSGSIKVAALNCKGSSSYRSLTVQSKPSFPGPINGPTDEVCAGTTSVVYSITATNGAASYTWTPPANATIISGQGTTSVTLDYAALFKSGTLKVTAENSCGSSSQRSLTVRSKPKIPGFINGPATICANQSGVSYSITPVTGASGYAWTVPAGAAIINGQNSNAVVLNFGAGGGTIKVHASNACGSSANSSLQVIVNCRETGGSRAADFNPVIQPNPGNSHFSLRFQAYNGSAVTFILRDVTGREIFRYDQLDPSAAFEFGAGLPAGIYFADLLCSDDRKVIRLINQ